MSAYSSHTQVKKKKDSVGSHRIERRGGVDDGGKMPPALPLRFTGYSHFYGPPPPTLKLD